MKTVKTRTPFLIWTMQRTGGTNLSAFLRRYSACERLQDEPFLPKRECGRLTADWIKDGDATALREAMAEVMAQRRNIKHCVENLPWEVSEALIPASLAQGYGHVALYRTNLLQRALSREYARRTKVWGPSRVVEDGEDAHAFEAPLDVEELVSHEIECARRLRAVVTRLSDAGAPVLLVSYEALYFSDEATGLATLKDLFATAGVNMGDRGFHRALEALRARGDQQTRDRYDRFQGLDLLRDRLAEAEEQVGFRAGLLPGRLQPAEG